MPKKPPRSTTDPFGRRMLEVLRQMGHEDDLNWLASQFGVTVQSTYDWINHGRIAKDRYARLVEWSGRPLDWWFGVPASLMRSRPPWPFASIDETRLSRCTPEQLARIEAGLLAVLAALGLDPQVTKRRGRVNDRATVHQLAPAAHRPAIAAKGAPGATPCRVIPWPTLRGGR